MMNKPNYHWQKKAYLLSSDSNSVLRHLSHANTIFLDISVVCNLTPLPRQDTLDLITELEEGGWVTYARKVAEKDKTTCSSTLYIGLSERVARRQLVARKFNATKYETSNI